MLVRHQKLKEYLAVVWLTLELLALSFWRRLFVLSFIAINLGSLAWSTPLSDVDTKEFIAATGASCMNGLRKEGATTVFSETQVTQYCSCFANRLAELTTYDDVKRYSETKDVSVNAKARKRAREFCAKRLSSPLATTDSKSFESSDSSITANKNRYKSKYVDVVTRNCLLAESDTLRFILTPLGAGALKAVCKCHATKSFDLVSQELAMKVATTKDVSSVGAQLSESIGYCVGDPSVIKPKERIAIIMFERCSARYNNVADSDNLIGRESFCSCYSVRISTHGNSWKEVSELPADKQRIMLADATSYCSGYLK